MTALKETRKFIQLSFQIITRTVPVNNEYEIKTNTMFLFNHTIHSMPVCQEEYLKNLNTIGDHEKAKELSYKNLTE